jgi:probable F420-dependent oxidoreductase
MRVGICLPQIGENTSPHVVDEFIGACEEVGFDSLWVQEHLFRPLSATPSFGGIRGRPWPDEHRRFLAPLELLAYAAGRTSRCTLGTSILVAGYHRPVDLAKRVATIDQLSRGRVALGLGVGWSEDEFVLVGAPFGHRGAVAEELIEAVLACWGPNPVKFEGRHFLIPSSETSPKPHRGDRVPLVSGFLSPAGRRRTARLCDVWQPYRLEPDDAVRELESLNATAADEFRRGPLQLSLRVLAWPEIPGLAHGGDPGPGIWAGDAAAMVAEVRRAAAAGCDEVVMDTSFTPSTGEEAVWLAQPEFFRPLVEAAHGA